MPPVPHGLLASSSLGLFERQLLRGGDVVVCAAGAHSRIQPSRSKRRGRGRGERERGADAARGTHRGSRRRYRHPTGAALDPARRAYADPVGSCPAVRLERLGCQISQVLDLVGVQLGEPRLRGRRLVVHAARAGGGDPRRRRVRASAPTPRRGSPRSRRSIRQGEERGILLRTHHVDRDGVQRRRRRLTGGSRGAGQLELRPARLGHRVGIAPGCIERGCTSLALQRFVTIIKKKCSNAN